MSQCVETNNTNELNLTYFEAKVKQTTIMMNNWATNYFNSTQIVARR